MQNDNVRKYRGFTKKTNSTENKQGRGTRKTKFQKGNYKDEKNTNKRGTQVGDWKVHRGDS